MAMFGPIATDGMPSIRSYTAATLYLERTKPFRDSDVRPLRKRGEKHKTIRRLNDGSIACRLYNTDLVVYHPDESVSVDSWDTQSSATFVHALTPVGLSAGIYRGQFMVTAVTPTGAVTLRAGASPLRFRRTDAALGTWECVNPETVQPHYRYFVNRERSAAIRERFKPFLQWMNAIIGITGGWVDEVIDTRVSGDWPEPLKQWQAAEQSYYGLRTVQSAASFLLSQHNTPEAAAEVYPILLYWLSRGKFRHLGAGMGALVSPGAGRELVERAYRIGGAIDKAEMPFGQLPPASKWGC